MISEDFIKYLVLGPIVVLALLALYKVFFHARPFHLSPQPWRWTTRIGCLSGYIVAWSLFLLLVLPLMGEHWADLLAAVFCLHALALAVAVTRLVFVGGRALLRRLRERPQRH